MKCIIKCGCFVVGEKVCDREEIVKMEKSGFIIIPKK